MEPVEIQPIKNRKSYFNKSFGIASVFVLVIGVFSAVFLSQQNQDTRSKASGSCKFVSDTSNTVEETGGQAVAAYKSSFWTADIPGATWIWSSYLVENPTGGETKTFVKTFYATLPVSSAVLTIAADNNFAIFLNGTQLYSDNSEFNFYVGNQHTYNLTPYIQSNLNILRIQVTNLPRSGFTAQTNPGGLLYRLAVEAPEGCGDQQPPTETPVPTNTPTPTDVPTPTEEPPTPTPTEVPTPTVAMQACTFTSDKTNVVEDTGLPAIATWQTPSWTVSIPGATWIWSSYLVQSSTRDETKTFVKTFAVSAPLRSAMLTIAADNYYWVYVNGVQVFANRTSSSNFYAGQEHVYNMAPHLREGTNTLRIQVRNIGQPGNAYSNPAGLLYKLAMGAGKCGVADPVPTNIVPTYTCLGACVTPSSSPTQTVAVSPSATPLSITPQVTPGPSQQERYMRRRAHEGLIRTLLDLIAQLLEALKAK